MLTDSIEHRLRALRASPVPTAAELRALVTTHLARAETLAADDPFIDGARAQQVAEACLSLLEALPTLDAEQASWVAAACLYYGAVDDDEDDFDSLVGFDDDAEVVNYVADLLGLSHIHIELD